MNTTDQFERDLRAMLADRAPRREPDALFEAVMTGTTSVRQRPGLLVGLRSGDVGTSPRTSVRLAPAVLIGLLLLSLATALAIVGSRLLEREPSIPEFRATGSMTVPRIMATAVRLTDGRVLVLGGFNFAGVSAPALATAEIYDPASGRFEPTGSMGAARTLASATLLSDGRVLVAGGYPVAPISGGGPPDAIATAEVYDPATGTFTPAGPMQEARAEHGAVLLPSGEVLVVGGVGGTERTGTGVNGIIRSTFERFDPTTGRFTLATGTLPSPIERPAAVLLRDGRVLVGNVGGFPYPVLTYEPNSDSVAALSQPDILVGAVVTLPDGRVLLTPDGEAGASQLYDPTSDTFGPIVSLERGPERAVVTERGGPVILFGRSLVAGSEVGSVDAFDPATSRVTTVGPMAVIRTSGFTATPLLDGSVLVAGGWAAGRSDSSTSSAELLVP